MDRRPLNTKQEKLLYAAKLMGIDNALKKIEDDISSKYNEQEELIELKLIK